MEYITYFFGIVIIGTLVFIYFVLRWMIEEKLKVYRLQDVFISPPMIVEKAYRARDFRASFEYTTYDYIEKYNPPFDYFSTQRVVRDEGHKQHIIEDFTHKLAKEMMESGVVEMTEKESIDNPFRRRIDLRVKVYQPEI